MGVAVLEKSMIVKAQCAFWYDSSLPRDNMVITPHFSKAAGPIDGEQLADDLATALSTWANASPMVTVKISDAQGTKPVYPIGEATVASGSHPESTAPREVALCLSYFSGRNVPRRRGRLYVPQACIGGSAGRRPTAGDQDDLVGLVGLLTALGGVDIDWCLFSKADNAAFSVTNYWVDNEWDTVRSRGLTPSGRIVGTVSE